MLSRSVRQVIYCKVVCTIAAAVGGAKMVALSTVSSEMMMDTREKCEAVLIRLPHILKLGEFFTN